MTEGYVRVDDGIDLFYRRTGSGRRVTLIPNGFYLEDLLQSAVGDRTLVLYDVRNRGRSSTIDDAARLARGVHADVDDLEAMRIHFGADRIDLVGHSYIGVLLMLYAARHPRCVGRIAALAPLGPQPARSYSPPLSFDDGTLASVMARLRALEPERARSAPEDFCRTAWSILAELYVINPADAARAVWGRCDLPNERTFMTYWLRYLLPSLNALTLGGADMQSVTAPALIVHGRKDRSAPYGGGRDWAEVLPNARLVTIDEGGHAPWIEAPDRVRDELQAFFSDELGGK
jgi:proline iminopeptidase